VGLKRTGYTFNRGVGLDRDVRSWFTKPLAPPEVPPDFIRSLVPPDAEAGGHRRQPWRLAGAAWSDRPRHGLQVPDWIAVRTEETEGDDLRLLDFSSDTPYPRPEGIGAECWRLLAEGLSEAEIVTHLATTCSVPREQVTADISTLIRELRESGLLQRSHPDSPW